MRIAVYHNVPAGGAKRAIYEMAKGLASRGHVLTEIGPSTAEFDWCSLAPLTESRKIFPLTWPKWQRHIPFVTPYLHLTASAVGVIRYHLLSKAMARWLESQCFDVLWANDCALMLNPPIAGYARVPTLLYIHHGSHMSCGSTDRDTAAVSSFVGRLKNIYFRPAMVAWDLISDGSERWAARHASAIACNSTVAQRFILQAYGKSSRVVHFGVDTVLFKPASHAERESYVLSAGTITPHKAFGFLVESLSTVPPSIRPPLWVASAHAEQEEMNRLSILAKDRGVVLTVVHPQSDEELVSLYAGARAFLFAARHEAFGLVVLEAMACGIPIVGVEDGGYVDSIVDGKTGFVTLRSPEAFGRALIKLLENPERRNEMGCNAREQVLNYWGWNRAVSDLEQCLLAVSNRPSTKVVA